VISVQKRFAFIEFPMYLYTNDAVFLFQQGMMNKQNDAAL